VCGFGVCYSGAANTAERVLAPLRQLGTPLADRVKSIDYVQLQRSTDSSDARVEAEYTKNGFVSQISEANIDSLLRGLHADPNRSSTVYFQHSGGAIARVKPGATAFPHRHAQANMMLFTNWPVGDDARPHLQSAREFWKTLEPYTRGFYVNEVEGNEGAATMNANYLGNYSRLAAIKRRYDPGNLFRLNANITPA
jgi:FAD/FMN-containing dehydrogenase